MSRRRWAFRLVLPVVVLAMACSCTEVYARWRWTPEDVVINPVHRVLLDHPTLFWVYKPSADITRPRCPPQHTNTLGLRDEEVQVPKPPGVFRILSLGESTTFGAWVGQHETYNDVIEDELGVEVVNAGHEAWTVWQSAIYLEEAGMALQPDMVLVYHEFNDFLPRGVINEQEVLYRVEYTDRQLYERRRPFAPVFGLLFQSRAYLMLRKWTLQLPSELPTIQEAIRTKARLGTRVPEEDRYVALARMLGLTAAAHIPLVILQPTYTDEAAQHRGTVLRDFAATHQLRYIDLRAARLGAGIADSSFFVDAIHPNPAGHTFLGHTISTALKDGLPQR